jgi:transcription elongation factor/antiterminator RfaH
VTISCANGAPRLEGREKWFLVHSLPRNEQRGCLHLQAQGFRTHLPLISKTIRHARRLRMARVPLFPRYLFVILDLDRDRWLSVRSTPGVASLFTCDDRPVAVPAGIVELLMEHDGEANLALLRDGIHRGQRVRIMSGPFAELVGTVDRLNETGRVRVLLNIMASAVPVSLDRSALLPAA